MLSKSQVATMLEVLAVGSMTAIGFAIGNPIATEAIKGIGLNLSSNLLQSGSTKLKESWFSSDHGILNHDIQQAFVRAFVQSSSLLETEYFKRHQPAAQSEKWAIEYLFGQFRQQSFEVFLISNESAITDSDLKDCLYAEPQRAEAVIWSRIESFLATYSLTLKKFLRENLLKTVVFCFGEELKKDTEQGKRAWRAFQRLMLEGIGAEIKILNANQELIRRDLGKLDLIARDIQTLDRVIRRDLIDSLGADLQIIRENVLQMRDRLDEIHGFMGKLKPQPAFDEFEFRSEYNDALHRVMTARSPYELNAVRHKIEYLEDKYPNKQEIYFLRDKFDRANRYETLNAPPTAIGMPQTSAETKQNIPYHPPIEYRAQSKNSMILVVVILLLLFLGIIAVGFLFGWWLIG